MGLHLFYTQAIGVQAEPRTTRPIAKGLDLTTPRELKGARLYSQPTKNEERARDELPSALTAFRKVWSSRIGCRTLGVVQD